ncbi:hypothetical protein [Nocardioides sp. SYSU DS0651]|uniref:hypothetical protein n=1 Tax=Nocardioides sp. SYSU DS0651 TaxID=3415955 RepID=UPI003F4AF82E
MAVSARRLVRRLLPSRAAVESVTPQVRVVPPIPVIVGGPDLQGGLAAEASGYLERAWALLRGLPRETWAVQAADAYARSGLTVDPESARRELRALAADAPSYVPADAWLALCSRVFGYGDQELARELWARLDESVGTPARDGVDKFVVQSRDWLRSWVAASNESPDAPAAPAGTVSYAVVDYGHPGRARASANIGDHVQTVASLGHVLKHQDLTFTGEPGLVDLADRLAARVRPDRVRHGVSGTVQLMTLERDASMYQEIPPDTWMLGFGWYMHPIFGMRYGFPFHKNLRPLFVSFHINQREMLTPEAIDYLKQYAPIGCRDHTTVDVLLSAGVPAFFSGCLTTTVTTLFPDLPTPPPEDALTGYVDVDSSKVPIGSPLYRQSADVVRFTPFVRNMDIAVEMLDRYRSNHRAMVTSRLHAYLPGRSVGIDIDFRPGNLADPRFVGLHPLDDEQFATIRDGIDALLEPVLGLALSGAPVDEVYAKWRELTEPLVARARARLEAPAAAEPLRTTLPAAVAERAVRTPAAVPADAVHAVVHLRKGQRPLLRRLVASIARHTSAPVHVWVLHRGLDLRVDELARRGVTLADVDLTGLGDDLVRPDGTKVPAGELDRLVAPALLSDVGRYVVLPPNGVLAEDLAGLAATELDGRLLAAPSALGTTTMVSGFHVVHAAARRLGETKVADRADRAAELRRTVHQRHAFDFAAFDVDVLVVDAAQARERDLLPTLASGIERFGLTYRGALHAEIGPERVVLPERWNVIPERSAVTDPALVRLAPDHDSRSKA